MFKTYNPYKPEDSRSASSEVIREDFGPLLDEFRPQEVEPEVPEGWRASKSAVGKQRLAPWVGTVGFHHPVTAVVDKAESSESTAWRVAGALAIIAGAVVLLLLY